MTAELLCQFQEEAFEDPIISRSRERQVLEQAGPHCDTRLGAAALLLLVHFPPICVDLSNLILAVLFRKAP